MKREIIIAGPGFFSLQAGVGANRSRNDHEVAVGVFVFPGLPIVEASS